MEVQTALRPNSFLLFFSLILLPAAFSTCGYESCPGVKEGYLNVHLVPHSHDDMGWLKTVDQYYYGANNSIQMASVQYILDSVVEELGKDPGRRFIYVETGFFWRWWTNQSPEKQLSVKALVSSGQLEFINGGWCMNDEATAHYNEIIDQMTLGLRFLNDTFGECGIPRVAWQIDPFGHAREQASLFARMGFDGLFFGRLDYQDKEYRELKKNMEMIWSGSPRNLGKNSWIFTGALFHGYNPPDGFCWDIICGDNPIMDDPKLLGYNLNEEIDSFINATREWASVYQTNQILMTMGSDFQFMAAPTWYKNLDKLITHVNSGRQESKINLIYSTPSCYLKEVNKAGLTLEVKRDDFFPYASSSHSFWTGYFTSRPALKFFIHQTNNFLQACKQFASNENSDEETLEKVFQLAEPMAVAQHHDAVSGTAKQHVTFDYALRLSRGIKSCEEVIGSRIQKLISEKGDQSGGGSGEESPRVEVLENNEIPPHLLGNQSKETIKFCHLLNISSCGPSETMDSFIIHIYNPLGRGLGPTFIRIPVTSQSWRVTGPKGDVLPTQLLPLPDPIFSIPGRISGAQFELVIPIAWLPPLTLQSIQATRLQSNEIIRNSPKFPSVRPNNAQGYSPGTISFSNNKGLGLTLDKESGLISSISRLSTTSIPETIQIQMSQNFFYYAGMKGTNERPELQASGAYIFRPNGTTPIPISTKASYSIHKGLHVTEIHQKFSNWVSQVIRLYEDSDAIELEYLIGPIPIGDNIGKEVITRYTSDLKTNGIFYTDSNGREILKRERNVRPTWKYELHEPVAGNYYPVNSRMILKEEGSAPSGKTLIVLNDRAQGGSSIQDGEMELMLHRRLLVDDAFGVGEALNDTAYGHGLVIRGKHWIVLAGSDTGVPTSIHRPLAQQIYRSPILAFQKSPSAGGNDEVSSFTNEIPQDVSYQNIPILDTKMVPILPANIHLLTYEKVSASTYLLRLEHFYEVGEDPVLSKKAFIPVEVLRKALGFESLRETMLGGNKWSSDSRRMNWMPKSDEKLTPAENNIKIKIYRDGDLIIEFQPMEIKTFVLFHANI